MPKSAISQGCLDEALTALKDFTADDLKDYVRSVFDKVRSYDKTFGEPALQKAIKEVNNEHLQNLFEDAMIKSNNIGKYNKLKSLIEKGIKLPEVLIRRHRNLDYNIESAQRAARIRMHDAFFSKLTPEEVHYIIKGDNDLEIARAIDGKESHQTARAIAERHKEYIDTRNAEIVTSNALPLSYINKDRHFRAIHNRSKMLSGGASLYQRAASAISKTASEDSKVRWIQIIKSHLNLDETFHGTDAMDLEGNLSLPEVDKMLSNIFNNIVNGRSEIFTRSTVANDEQAIAKLTRRFFVWKDMESFTKYNKLYGYDSYAGALMSDIESAGSKVGMAQIMGGNPTSQYKHLKEAAFEKGQIKAWGSTKADLYFQQVSGQNNLAASPTLATLGSNIRSYTSMARLGSLAIQSLNDVSNNIVFAKEFGYDFYKAYSDTLSGLFDAVPNKDRKYLAGIFKANVDSHLGYIGKYSDAHSVGDITRKVSGLYYRKIGMEALDKGNKMSAIQMMSKHLSNMGSRNFSKLNEETRSYLEKFNVTDTDWDVLRGKTKNGLFTMENVDALTDSEVKEIFNKSDKHIPLSDMRNHIYRKVYSMFDTASEDAILAPNAFSKAWCALGTRPGTALGEALRFFMQFKAYPIRYIDRYWASFMNADSATSKLAFAAQMLAATIPMSLLSQTLDSYLKGKTPPNPSKMNYPELLKYSVGTVAGGLGVFQKVLDPKNQNKDLISSVINSPSLQLLSDSSAIPFELFTGNVKGLKKSLKNISTDVTPIESLPLIAPLIRKMMGEKAYLQPGQEQLYGA